MFRFRLNSAGMSLVNVVIVATVLALAVMAFNQFFNTSVRATRSLALRGDEATFKTDLEQGLDCKETFEALGCAPGAACAAAKCTIKTNWADIVYIPLRDKNGNIIGVPNGNFANDTDKPIFKIGSLSYAAVCTPTALDVWAGRPQKDAAGNWIFELDPLTKQPKIFKQLFAPGQRANCSWMLGPDSNPRVKRILASGTLTLNQTTAQIRTNGLGDAGGVCGILSTVVGNSINVWTATGYYNSYPNPHYLSNPRFWTGSAICDPGYTPVSAAIYLPPVGSNPVVALGYSSAGGVIQDSLPDPNNKRRWIVNGCYYTKRADEAGAPATGTTVANTFIVTCVRDD